MKMPSKVILLLAMVFGLIVSARSLAGDKKDKDVPPPKDLNINGELTENDVKDRVRTDSYCKTFTLRMIKGHTYQIDMKSADFDPYLRLENPAGEQVASDDDGGDGLNARIIYKANESGSFKVIATTFGAGGKGKFVLTTKDKDAPAGKGAELKLDKGQAAYTGNITKDDPLYNGKKHKLITVTLEAGKTYQIDMKSGALDSFLFLESPDGKLLARDDDGGGFPDARIVHKADANGRYRIICTYFGGGGEGEFTLTVREEK